MENGSWVCVDTRGQSQDACDGHNYSTKQSRDKLELLYSGDRATSLVI